MPEDRQGKRWVKENKNLHTHKWVGQKMGGNPACAESYEWVRYCSMCGMEDTCEDPLPPCLFRKRSLIERLIRLPIVFVLHYRIGRNPVVAWRLALLTLKREAQP